MTENPKASLHLRTLCGGAVFFLILSSYYVLKPIRESLFLDVEGYQNFPVVHILGGVVTYFAAGAYDWLARRWRGGYLAVRVIPFAMAVIIVFWLLVQVVPADTWMFRAFVVWPYYLGVSLFAVFLVCVFWSLAHAAFTPEEGRKAYGLVGSGGILGSGVGALLTKHLVGPLGTLNLVLLSVVLLIPCIPLALWLDKVRIEDAEMARAREKSKASTSWSLLLKDRYVGAMGLMLFLTLALAELGDHQSQRVLDGAGWERDQITQFYGHMYMVTNLAGLFISLVVTRFIQVRFGPGPGLVLLFLTIINKAVFMAVSPTTTTLFYTWVVEYAVHYSIFQSSKELLYTPTSEDVKFRAKTLIDTFIFRLGVALGAVWVLVFLNHSKMESISVNILVLSVPTIWLGVWLHRKFNQLIADMEAGKAQAQ